MQKHASSKPVVESSIFSAIICWSRSTWTRNCFFYLNSYGASGDNNEFQKAKKIDFLKFALLFINVQQHSEIRGFYRVVIMQITRGHNSWPQPKTSVRTTIINFPLGLRKYFWIESNLNSGLRIWIVRVQQKVN